MKVSIVILTYNRSERLNFLLEDLVALSTSVEEVIVVDNCSTDKTATVVGNFSFYVKYIKMTSNIGVTARNYGLKEASGDIIITLDDDIIDLSEKDVMVIKEKFLLNKELGAMNFKILDPFHQVSNWVHHRKKELYSDKTFETYEITEGAVAFRKEALRKAGSYDEIFFISHEGPDLAFRLMEKGFRVIYTGDVSIVHLHDQKTRSKWRNYYFDTRNQFLLAYKNFPLSYTIQYLGRGLPSMFLYSTRDGYLRYWFKGVIDGIRILKKKKINRHKLSASTMHTIWQIDKERPNLLYMLKSRFLQRGMRI